VFAGRSKSIYDYFTSHIEIKNNLEQIFLRSDEIFIRIKRFLVSHGITCYLVNINFVSKEAADSTKTFTELVSI